MTRSKAPVRGDGNAGDQEFERHRARLLGLAYRMLGSMWDAEDAVQDAYLRWMNADRAAVADPRAFLVTVVSRLCLDQLRSARVTREAYPGPWLPEPVSTAPGGPLEATERRDSLSFATLHMMERLSPPERAVFVLREAFDLPFAEIGAIIGTSPEACRQLLHRARTRVTGHHRFQPDPAGHAELVRRFLDAAGAGDLDALSALLADDVIAWNDGGGKVRAALRPLVAKNQVLAFAGVVLRQYPIESTLLMEINGELAAWVVTGDREQIIAFDIYDGLIHGIFAVANPDKLGYARPRPDGSDGPRHQDRAARS